MGVRKKRVILQNYNFMFFYFEFLNLNQLPELEIRKLNLTIPERGNFGPWEHGNFGKYYQVVHHIIIL